MDALGILKRIGNGHLIEDIAEALAEVGANVVETGKPGQVTVTLKVSVQQVGDPMVIVNDTVARKMPTKAARGVLLYAVDGGLHTRDPRQVEMEFRRVDPAQTEIRESDGGAPVVREA